MRFSNACAEARSMKLRYVAAVGKRRVGVWTFFKCNRKGCEMCRYASGWESQRDSAPKPRVARNELPWEPFGAGHNPKGVASRSQHGGHTSQPADCASAASTRPRIGHNPVGVEMLRILAPRVARSDLATLGFEAKSLWDLFAEMSKLQAATVKRRGRSSQSLSAPSPACVEALAVGQAQLRKC